MSPSRNTPCCYANICARKTTKGCVCDKCFDLRQRKLSELHEWKLKTNLTVVKCFTNESACRVIQRHNIRNILFIGDSLIRHVNTAFLIMFKNDMKKGALEPAFVRGCKAPMFWTMAIHKKRVYISYIATQERV